MEELYHQSKGDLINFVNAARILIFLFKWNRYDPVREP